MDWKIPPKEKIYEALSALADKRFEIISPGHAVVTSSGGDKQYNVSWTALDGQVKINSNDNASRWQGYTGYPIITILLETGYIRFKPELVNYLKGIPWNKINKSHRNNYAAAVEEVLSTLDDNIKQQIRDEVETIFDQLSALRLIR